MSRRRRLTIWLAVEIAAAMGVYPPWACVAANGRSASVGYSWIFGPPDGVCYGAEVDIARLLIQWAIVAAVGVTVWSVGPPVEQVVGVLNLAEWLIVACQKAVRFCGRAMEFAVYSIALVSVGYVYFLGCDALQRMADPILPWHPNLAHWMFWCATAAVTLVALFVRALLEEMAESPSGPLPRRLARGLVSLVKSMNSIGTEGRNRRL
jgi:hypothetical protein